MSAKIFTIIVIRLLSIYIFFESVYMLINSFIVLFKAGGGILLSSGFALIIFALALWVYAPKISEKIVDNYSSIEFIEPKAKYHIESNIVLLLGLFFTVEAFSSIVSKIFFAINIDIMQTPVMAGVNVSLISNTIYEVLRLIIGVVFILYAHKIGAYFKKKFNNI